MQQDEIILNGRFQLLERIGSGGMSVVYKAQDRVLGRIVAIKLLHESLTSDEGFLQRFQQEAHAAANLTHPNIVTVHDIGQDGYRHYMVMEYVAGKTLKQVVRDTVADDKFMPTSRTLDLVIQICNGIGYAHRAGLIHCDVKPHNVIVSPDERVKVADFGIARAISGATQQQIVSQVWGTPQYFSPEQASGNATTPAADVYAIGVVMFEMLSGRLPFTAESHTAMALKHIQAEPPLLSEFNPAVPHQLEQIVNKLLSKEPTGRYRTAGQLGRVLSSYRERSQAETGLSQPIRITSTKTTPPQPPITPVAEQKTEIYERPPVTERKTAPHTAVSRPSRVQTHSKPQNAPQAQADIADWTAVTLGITALVALLGLIPLWWFVYRAWVN
ncbi:MAG: serine/threonine protein kinase [Chloroflexi bacterium]|nr:serine/threonine protein kinase [Chloroflexota bacterium]